MTLELPGPVTAYLEADGSDGKAVARCFTDNAVVKDEGHAYHGREAIRRWKEASSEKYTYTCEPLKSEEQDCKSVVTCRLTGNFPGSPASLRFCFELQGEQIASLEIVP